MTWTEITGTVVSLLVASGVGAILLAIVQHFLGRRTQKVDQTVKIGNAWDQLVNELKANRVTLRKELSELRVWRGEASNRISTLETNDITKRQLISTLQDENERLCRSVEVLTQGNEHLSVRLTNLRDRIRVLEEENKELKRENDELRNVRST